MSLSISPEKLELAEAAVAEGRAASVEEHIETLLHEDAIDAWALRNREALVVMIEEAEASPPETRSLAELREASLAKLREEQPGRASA